MVNYCKSRVCLNGKTAIVTGSNTGIGYHTALDLATRGARVILACRNLEKANEARNSIIEATANSHVVVKLLDLTSLKSVRAFAEDINKTETRLDILVNNAGAGYLPQEYTEDGLQIEMATNYFSPFLLTHLLIDLMKKSAPSRIINVSSSVAKFIRQLDIQKINENESESWLYAKSKLCNIYFTQTLASKLEGTGVTTYSLHPGAVHTEFQRFSYWLNFIGGYFFKKDDITACFAHFQTAEQGAQTSIYLAVEKNIEEFNGRHFHDCTPVADYYNAKDASIASELWRVTQELVKLQENEEL